MTSNRDDPSRSSRIVRAAYRLVRTNRLPLEARLSTNSCSTRRRPGKLSNVRSSRNSSSRNVAGSPAARAGAGEEGERGVEGAAGAGRRAFADRKRRGRRRPRAESVRASSPCARRRSTAPTSGPADRASCCSSVVRPLPHPPTSTGIRDGDASSAETMRRVRVLRGVNMRGASTGAVCAKTKDRH